MYLLVFKFMNLRLLKKHLSLFSQLSVALLVNNTKNTARKQLSCSSEQEKHKENMEYKWMKSTEE